MLLKFLFEEDQRPRAKNYNALDIIAYCFGISTTYDGGKFAIWCASQWPNEIVLKRMIEEARDGRVSGFSHNLLLIRASFS